MINTRINRFTNRNQNPEQSKISVQIFDRPTNQSPIITRPKNLDRIANLTDRELFSLCRQCGANIRRFQREFACYLPEVEKRRLHKHHGCHTLYEFAAKQAGMTKDTVDEILKVHQKLIDKPILRSLMMEQGWGKLRIVASIATLETQEFWAEKVITMSKITLQTFVNELKKRAAVGATATCRHRVGAAVVNNLPNENAGVMGGKVEGAEAGKGAMNAEIEKEAGVMNGQVIHGAAVVGQLALEAHESLGSGAMAGALIAQQFDLFGDEDSRTGSGNPMETSHKMAMTFKLDGDVETKIRIFKLRLEKKMKEPQDWNQTIKELLKIAEQHEACAKSRTREIKVDEREHKEEIQKSLPCCDKRYIPARVRHYLEQKYHGKCGFSNCKNPSEIFHHTRRFSLERNHDPDFIVPLCKPHERLAHHGLIQNEKLPVEKWQVQLQPDKTSPKYPIDRMVQRYRAPAH